MSLAIRVTDTIRAPGHNAPGRRQRRCRNGHGFYYLADSLRCPQCGDGPRFNRRLHRSKLDNHLLNQAAIARGEPDTSGVTSDIDYSEL